MSKWTHAICVKCWNERNPDRQAVNIRSEYSRLDICCFCGKLTYAGIYVRVDPNDDELRFCNHKEED